MAETPKATTEQPAPAGEAAKTTAKKREPATPAPVPHEALSLRQKLVEMRKALPTIKKERHSEGVKYAYSKVDAIWGPIRPIMDELGVMFEFVREEPCKKDANGNPVYWQTMTTKTKQGDKLMWLYECDMVYRWVNVDNDDETLEVTLHAIGWNDDPAKAKGAARTYAVKYYLWDEFSVDQGEEDPDNNDFGATGKQGQKQDGQKGQQQPGDAPKLLTDPQLERMYKKGEAAGFSRESVNKRISEKYYKGNPAELSRAQYEEICAALDAAAAQGGKPHA